MYIFVILCTWNPSDSKLRRFTRSQVQLEPVSSPSGSPSRGSKSRRSLAPWQRHNQRTEKSGQVKRMLLVKHIKIHQTYKTVDFHIFHCIHTYYRIFLSSAQNIIRFQLSSKELCLVAFSESSMHKVNWSKQYLKLYAFDSVIHPRSISVVVFVESFLILPQAPRRGSQRLCSLTFNAFEKQRKRERESILSKFGLWRNVYRAKNHCRITTDRGLGDDHRNLDREWDRSPVVLSCLFNGGVEKPQEETEEWQFHPLRQLSCLNLF